MRRECVCASTRVGPEGFFGARAGETTPRYRDYDLGCFLSFIKGKPNSPSMERVHDLLSYTVPNNVVISEAVNLGTPMPYDIKWCPEARRPEPRLPRLHAPPR